MECWVTISKQEVQLSESVGTSRPDSKLGIATNSTKIRLENLSLATNRAGKQQKEKKKDDFQP